MALTANKNRATKAHERRLNTVPANAGEVFYNGGYIVREAATGVATKTPALNAKSLGVLVEPLFPDDPDKALNAHLDNSAGADGAFNPDGTGERLLRYDQTGEYAFAVQSGTPKVGDLAYLVDDDTVDTVDPGHGVVAGVFTRPAPTGTAEWFVDIGRRS